MQITTVLRKLADGEPTAAAAELYSVDPSVVVTDAAVRRAVERVLVDAGYLPPAR